MDARTHRVLMKATSRKSLHLIIHCGDRVHNVVAKSNGDHLRGVSTEQPGLQSKVWKGEVGGRFP